MSTRTTSSRQTIATVALIASLALVWALTAVPLAVPAASGQSGPPTEDIGCMDRFFDPCELEPFPGGGPASPCDGPNEVGAADILQSETDVCVSTSDCPPGTWGVGWGDTRVCVPSVDVLCGLADPVQESCELLVP